MLVTTSSSRSRRRAALVGGVLLTVTAAGLTGPSAGAGPAPGRAAPASGQPSQGGGAHGETPGNFDARTVTSRTVLRSTAEVLGRRGDAVAKLAGRLGADAEIELDGVTGTPRHVADRTGFLTGASGRAADAVALGWVRDNLAGLGLVRADLDTLVKRQQVTDINGITHVSWVQQVDGVPVFGNGLRAHVDRRGRLIAVQGAPGGAASPPSRPAPPTRGWAPPTPPGPPSATCGGRPPSCATARPRSRCGSRRRAVCAPAGSPTPSRRGRGLPARRRRRHRTHAVPPQHR